MFLLTSRWLNFLLALSAFSLILTGILYFQNHLGMLPCPLCVFQRIAFMGIILFSLLAALVKPNGKALRVFSALGFIVATIGAGIAARHTWLQGNPAEYMPSCGPDLSYMMRNFPMQDVISTVFQGSGDCADLHWSFLGLTIPGWALVWFVFFMVVLGLQAWKGDLMALVRRRIQG